MTHRVRIAPPVLQQIEDQVDYYLREGASIEVVTKWTTELYDRLEALSEHPKRFPVDDQRTNALGREIRRLEHGSFSVFYRVNDESSDVEILDIRHGKRKKVTGDKSD